VRQLYLVLDDLVIKLVAICEIRHFLSNHIGLCQLQHLSHNPPHKRLPLRLH